ncbi:MAG: thioredoxin domain-containing protein, partial [Clostridiales bacterium]|nr:thioredoxin domain-containing protein [Clostridiales bacterium]
PVLGRVTMDQTIVDVTDVPGVFSGEEAVLVGSQNGREIPITEFSDYRCPFCRKAHVQLRKLVEQISTKRNK